MPPGEMPLRSTYSFRYALPLLQAEIPSVSTWLARLLAIMPAAASGSSALISPFTPDLPATIPPPAALFEVNARVTTLNHRFVVFNFVLGGIIFLKKENVKGKLRFFIPDKREFDARAVSFSQSRSVSVCFSQLSGRLTTRLTEIGGKLDPGSNGWILTKSISVS